MSIRRIIDWAIAQADGQMVGKIASPFYQLFDDASGWVWAADVDISQNGQEQVLQGVPIASNNRDIIYAQEGKAVALQKMGNGKWAIAGLAKSSRGLGHIMYVTFQDDIAQIASEGWHGYVYRPLTYGELAIYGGYGVLPYGCRGKFAQDGTLIEILGS
jgi:hypothetical protein